MDGTLKELGNGKYRCRISFVDENGKRVQRSKTYTAAGKKEARQIMRQFKDKCQKNNVPQPLLTLNDLHESFKKYHCCNVQEGTKQAYGYSWKLLETYHNKQLSTIKPNVIKEMLNVAEKDSRSQKAVYQLISAMYGYANCSELLNYNPCTNVAAPKYKAKEKKTLSDKQKELLSTIIETQPKKYQVIYYLTITLGFRREEVCALKWSDINFDEKTLRVNRTAIALSGQGTVIKDLGKNDRAKIALPLTDKHIEILKDYKSYTAEELMKRNVDTDFLFYRRNGYVVDVCGVSQWFKEFFEANGIYDITFHSLRHTCATNLLQQGTDIATVAAILRDSIETVAKTYLHTDEKVMRNAITALSENNL